MPAAVDHPAIREQVRLIYLGNGRNLTLAAKTVGIPVDRAEKWKERGKWDESKDPAAQQLSSVSECVGATADNLEKQLAADSKATRTALAVAARKGAETFAQKTGDEVIKLAKPLQQLTSATGMIHGWGDKGQEQGADLFVLSIGGNVNLGGQHVHGAKAGE